ncbi:acyltransferase [Mucilaginibacter sp.]|uniref:acyltransferase family protein n=1 Tax=Mucilaginibacter sp. TaxID=1882438 RepID=UPI002843FAC6|nr:acyltransferase [Mucilaginibacter sp.]MDR3693364.1 acyltransferase [Mucilaginibacter sp.]
MVNVVGVENSSVENSNESRVGVLDILRAMAITFVVLTHYKEQIFPGGSIGVSIFFCLSGYLITRNLLRKDVSIPNFLIRRIFRIYPAYLFVCFLHLFILYYTRSTYYETYVNELPNFLLIIKMPEKWLGYGVGVFWTLQIELMFYFLIPFLIKWTDSIIRKSIVISLIVISVFLKLMVFWDVFQLSTYSIFRTFYWMDNLLYGTLAALLLEKFDFKKLNAKSKQMLAVLSFLLFLIFLTIASFVIFWTSIGKFWPFQSSLTSLLTGIIIFFSLKYQLLNNIRPKIISLISLLAYSIYLAHPFPLDYFFPCKHFFNVSNIEYKAITLTALILLILFLHYVIEKPGMKLGKRLSDFIAAK